MQWQYEFQFVVCVLSAVRRVTESHAALHSTHTFSLYSSQSSDAGVLFCLTNTVWFLLVASLVIQNVMQSAHAYRRFGIAAGSETKYWSKKTMTLYSTSLTIVTVCGLNSRNRNRSYCEDFTDVGKQAIDLFAFISFS